MAYESRKECPIQLSNKNNASIELSHLKWEYTSKTLKGKYIRTKERNVKMLGVWRRTPVKRLSSQEE